MEGWDRPRTMDDAVPVAERRRGTGKDGRMEDWAMVSGDGSGRGVGLPWRVAVGCRA
jgi:hypothetical protein